MKPRAVIARALRKTGWTWRWLLNIDRTLPYRLFDHGDPVPDDLRELRQNGILIRPAHAFLGASGLQHLQEAAAWVGRRCQDEDVRNFLQAEKRSGTKNFRVSLLPRELETTSPFVQLAIDPGLLGMVNDYLGMRSLLRSVNAWIDVPTAKPPTETQLWHRDDDDYSNLKVFIYLNEVQPDNGPFCFIPRTYPRGDRPVPAAIERRQRTNDADMEHFLPMNQWRICTGAAQTVILADTRAYHKGMQPRAGKRILLVLQYTSGKPNCPRSLIVKGPAPLIPAQKHALAA